jgi:hypothetical protein
VRNGFRIGWWIVSIASVLAMRAEALAQYVSSGRSGGAGGAAPAGLYVTPSLTLSEYYDDNITAAVQGDPTKESDFVFRSQPGIIAGYRSAPFSLLGSYSISADVYAEHPDFNVFPATQQASLLANYLPTQRLSLMASGGYQESQYANQLNSAQVSQQTGLPATGLSNGRARSELYYAGATSSYALTPLTDASADYRFDHNHQVGNATNESHDADARLSHRFTEVDVGDVGGIYRHFSSSQPQTAAPTPQPEPTPAPSAILVLPEITDSYAVTFGWSHRFELTEIAVRAGPRFSNDASVHAEAYASITRKLARGSANFTYLNTQSSSVGVGGAVNVSSYAGNLTYNLLESLTSGLNLGLYQNSNPGQGQSKVSDVYTAGMSLHYRLLEWLSIVLNYSFSYQDGVVSPVTTTSSSNIVISQQNNNVQINIVSIGLEYSEPFRVY